MRVIAIFLNIMYLSLMLYACIRSNKWKQLSTNLICAGCIALSAYTLLFVFKNVIMLEITGMLLISGGALLNGRKQEQINPLHHIIRAVLEILIIVLLVI